MDDASWKDQYKSWKSLNPSQIKLLDDGPNTLSQTWLLSSMWCEWKEIKKLKDTELPHLKDKQITSINEDPWYD